MVFTMFVAASHIPSVFLSEKIHSFVYLGVFCYLCQHVNKTCLTSVRICITGYQIYANQKMAKYLQSHLIHYKEKYVR